MKTPLKYYGRALTHQVHIDIKANVQFGNSYTFRSENHVVCNSINGTTTHHVGVSESHSHDGIAN